MKEALHKIKVTAVALPAQSTAVSKSLAPPRRVTLRPGRLWCRRRCGRPGRHRRDELLMRRCGYCRSRSIASPLRLIVQRPYRSDAIAVGVNAVLIPLDTDARHDW